MDCAGCHGPDQGEPSVRPLITEKALTPRVTFGPGIPESVGTDWIAALEDELRSTGLVIASGDDWRTVPVDIHVTVDVGDGRTDAGVAFLAARAHATITVGRGRVEIHGRAAACRERDRAVLEALESVRSRVEDAIAF